MSVAHGVHDYSLDLTWTGNLGTGTADNRAYSRDHQISGPEKSGPISGTSDPAFRGDPARYNPEELLIGALSACHMLWVLNLCAGAGIVVTAYTDSPTGQMRENPDGSGDFTNVTLRPKLQITDPARIPELEMVHHKAHEMCFISRGVKFPVAVEPATAEPTPEPPE